MIKLVIIKFLKIASLIVREKEIILRLLKIKVKEIKSKGLIVKL